jgi:metal-dependent amidase/aminoacylase/carboxypeptidase family protein
MKSKQLRKEQIARWAADLRNGLVGLRRDIYMHPELSGQEQRTASIVADHLSQAGLEVRTGIGGNGVIGLLQGQKEGPVIAWRADMDAFAIPDILDVPYKSSVPGVKHVCGHDVHTTIGIGIARVLALLQDEIAGSIKFIFQPAEETATGARAMIQAGALSNPTPEAIFALHAAPLPVGQIGCVPGMVLPGIAKFEITLKSKNESVERLRDAAENCVAALGSLSSLRFPDSEELSGFLHAMETGESKALTQFILVSCWQESGSMLKHNTLQLQGLVRAASEQLEEHAKLMIRTTLDKIIGELPGAYDLQWLEQLSLPPTINHVPLERQLRPAIASMIGATNTVELRAPFPFNSEDFSLYQQQLPGVFYWLGVANLAKGIIGVPHLPNFDVDEECLVVGTKTMAHLLLHYLDSCVRIRH